MRATPSRWLRAVDRARAVQPRTIVFAAWLIVIVYAFPGYMNWDSGDQVYQGRIGELEDWHPPIMGAYWHLIEVFVRGPFGMLVLQTSLFAWGLYAALSTRFQPRTAALVTALLLVFPPVLTPMAAVWKDAQMAGFLVAGVMLAVRPRWRTRLLGLALLVLAAGVRDNGVAAVLPLCLLVVATWTARRRFFVLVAGLGLCIALAVVATVANRGTVYRKTHPWFKTVAIHDLAGTICLEDPMTDAEVREALDGVKLLIPSDLQYNLCKQYNPRVWFALSFGEQPIFPYLPDKPDRFARRRAWFRMLRDHTHAFLSHRWSVMKEVLGLAESPPWEPVCQTFAANPDHLQRISHAHSLSDTQARLGKWFLESWSTTLLFRPWAYALVGLILLGYAIRRRDRFLFALLGSGLLYEASLFVGAAAPDFRYSHWMITCTCVAALVIFGERLRAGFEARRRGTA